MEASQLTPELKQLIEDLSQDVAAVKMLVPNMKAKQLGRVILAFIGSPFIGGPSTLQGANELNLFMKLVRLSDKRMALIEKVTLELETPQVPEPTTEAVEGAK